MAFIISVFLTLIVGVVAGLIAGNAHFRFRLEKALRKFLRKPLVSVTLISFTNFCDGGIFLIHCIGLKNNMWFTPKIPGVYFLSRGTFAHDAHAYKPFVYFRAHGLSNWRTSSTLNELLRECADQIMPYAPDNSSLRMDISKVVPIRVVVICELVDSSNFKQGEALNHIKVIGELHAAVANPMPTVSPGSWWDMSIISKDFGFIDGLHITIPKDLEEQEPLGDKMDVYQMKNRPPCLLDINYFGFTWPLRFKVNNRELRIKGAGPPKRGIKVQ